MALPICEDMSESIPSIKVFPHSSHKVVYLPLDTIAIGAEDISDISSSVVVIESASLSSSGSNRLVTEWALSILRAQQASGYDWHL